MSEKQQAQVQNQGPTPEQAEADFFARFTAGLDEDPTADTASQEPSATPLIKTGDDQDSKDASEGAPNKGSQSPDAESKEDKTQSEKAPAPKENINVEEHFDKSSKAFAEQRIQIKQRDGFIMDLAKAAGFDVKDSTEAMEKLRINLTNIEAKKKNVDPLVLQQLQQREAAIAEQEKQQLRQEAHTGFDKLRTQFNLDNNKLLAFAQQLQTAGINPFEQRVNLEQQYKLLNYDTLLAEAREAGRQEEIARRTKAQTSSTTPSGKVGGTQPDTGESLDTVEKLRAFLQIK